MLDFATSSPPLDATLENSTLSAEFVSRTRATLATALAPIPLVPVSPQATEAFVIPPGGNRTLGYQVAKRLLDILGSIALIVLLSPMMLFTFLVLCITTRGRPLFAQQRLGLCGRPFRLFKFRTMVLNAPSIRHTVENEQAGPIFKNRRDPRITRFGKFLRSFSVDETPQLFNVLWGSMSLVGPRPPLAEEVARYEPWQRRRLSTKPGLTCLWQVSGRSEIGFDEWMHMDLWYLEHQSLRTDLYLLFKTPLTVLSRRGAY